MSANEQTTEAIHVQVGDNHVVGVKALHVLLSADCGMWIAQGLEIDYASAGETVDQAKTNFQFGLKSTICEHLKLHGDIKKFLVVSPQEVWDEYYSAPKNSLKQEYSTIQLHSIPSSLEDERDSEELEFPFDSITYLAPNSVERIAA